MVYFDLYSISGNIWRFNRLLHIWYPLLLFVIITVVDLKITKLTVVLLHLQITRQSPLRFAPIHHLLLVQSVG